jgi:hypothetical protein
VAEPVDPSDDWLRTRGRQVRTVQVYPLDPATKTFGSPVPVHATRGAVTGGQPAGDWSAGAPTATWFLLAADFGETYPPPLSVLADGAEEWALIRIDASPLGAVLTATGERTK